LAAESGTGAETRSDSPCALDPSLSALSRSRLPPPIAAATHAPPSLFIATALTPRLFSFDPHSTQMCSLKWNDDINNPEIFSEGSGDWVSMTTASGFQRM